MLRDVNGFKELYGILSDLKGVYRGLRHLRVKFISYGISNSVAPTGRGAQWAVGFVIQIIKT